jgi:hypothetical protein
VSEHKTPEQQVADALQGDFPKNVGKSSGSTVGYTVEARYNSFEPKQIGGVLLDNRWRRLDFAPGSPGVPVAKIHESELTRNRLMNYPGAQALRWWFIANCEAEGFWGGSLCVDTRLVKHQVVYSYETTAEIAQAYIGSEDRSSMRADWSNKS